MLGGGAGGGATDPGDRFCKKKGQVMAPKMSMFDEGMLKANGCGPMGMQVTEEYGLYQCCNQHDLCYSICNPGFEWCEKQFKKCMAQVCKKVADSSGCNEKANGFSSMTKVFGSASYGEGLEQSCDCLPPAKAEARNEEFLRHAYGLFNRTALEDPGFVTATLAKYKKKEGQLWFNLLKRYGVQANLVEFVDIKAEL
jgi:secretory phospholipase A2